ncbi:MAG: helix-turn-helix domain-containing protein [Cyanobacteriota bacterium]
MAAPTRMDPLLEAGRTLRQSREAAGLSLRDLAQDTRISTPVLEALERGWRDRLPEEAYLRTMVPLLERRLQLTEGSLQAALPCLAGESPETGRRRLLLRRFTPGSIDVFSSWQGTVLYGALTLGLIYAINLQQERLANANLLTRSPIAPLAIPTTPRPSIDGNSLLLQSYPDLRPLSRPGQALRLDSLADEPSQPAFRRLLLKLQQPSRVTITAGDGHQLIDLQGASGTLTLPLLPPLNVMIEPPPPQGSVLWNDAAIKAQARLPGQFRIGPRP